MLHLILVETALELISPKHRSLSSVLNNVKKYGNPGRILDSALHHSFMKNLQDHLRRGRPDILHQFILTCLSSILNKQKQLRIFFHTRHDEIYEINPNMRAPKDYIRFKGLMYQLLNEKQIVISHPVYEDSPDKERKSIEDDWLISKKNLPLMGFVKSLNPDKILRFTTKGTLTNQDTVFGFMNVHPDINVLAIIGGFQSGSFSSKIMEIDAEDISIYPEGLETNAVVNRVIINFENAIKSHHEDYYGSQQKAK
jgi:rRNA small subunit pseudouridine methyltransferase Nep1